MGNGGTEHILTFEGIKEPVKGLTGGVVSAGFSKFNFDARKAGIEGCR
jgi:hypothetical protein